MSYKILLDMDGVLADFYGYAMKLHGIETWPAPSKRGVDQLLGISRDEFWNLTYGLDANFWLNIEPYPYAREFVDLLSKLPLTTLYVLSRPTNHGRCHQHKFEWIKKYFPELTENVMLARDKSLCARSNHLLIDDDEDNTIPFQIHGGKSLLFPQIWNSGQTPFTQKMVRPFAEQAADILFMPKQIIQDSFNKK